MADDQKKEQNVNFKTQKQEGKRGWYVIHTYTGYEDQAAFSEEQRGSPLPLPLRGVDR